MAKHTSKQRTKRIINIPVEYLEGIDIGKPIFPYLFQFENGLRLYIHNFLVMLWTRLVGTIIKAKKNRYI